MTNPKDWRILRKMYRETYNLKVIKYFSDVGDTYDETNPRHIVKKYCLIDVDDGPVIANIKINYFYNEVLQIWDKPAIIGIEKDEYDQRVRYQYSPIVTIKCTQDRSATPKGKQPLKSEWSFRLFKETSTTITETELKAVGLRIKNAFTDFKYDKGKLLFTYQDLPLGIDTRFLVQTQLEAETIAKKICACADITFKESILLGNTPFKNSDNTPGTIKILGETKSLPSYRPTAIMHFRYAYCTMYASREKHYLYDATGTHFALIK